MHHYLVVANQTLGGDELLACVRERVRAGPSQFHVLVPATPASQLDQEYVASVPEHVRLAASAQPGDDEQCHRHGPRPDCQPNEPIEDEEAAQAI